MKLRRLSSANCPSGQRSGLVFGIVMVAMVWTSCSKKVDITAMAASGKIAQRCVQVIQPMYLVQVAETEIEFPEIRARRLVRPNGLFAPSAEPNSMAGSTADNPGVETLGVVEQGTKFTVLQIWSLRFFDGESLAVLAEVSVGGNPPQLTDITEVMNELWIIDLADGRVSEMEREELLGIAVLDERFARFCGESGNGAM